jgi:hypothetical protein
MIGIGLHIGNRVMGGSGAAPFVGLLDVYPSASRAYSLRLLRTAYTGFAIRVRRSSDNAEQDIGFTSSGNLDTTALTSFVGGSNGFVTTWYDQSGNGANATNSTASNQPVIVTAGVVNIVNSKPAVYFNNGLTTQLNSTLISYNDFTILWVSKKATATVVASIILRGDGGDYSGDDVDGTGNPNLYTGALVIGTGNGNTSPSGNAKLNQHLAYLNRRNSNQAVGQFNNSNNSYNNSVSANVFKNNGIANYGGGYNYVGDLQEIIIYANDQSANRTGISSNINTYYGIY